MESELCIVRRVEEEYRALNPPRGRWGGASSGRFSVGSSQKSSRSGGARSWRLRSSTPSTTRSWTAWMPSSASTPRPRERLPHVRIDPFGPAPAGPFCAVTHARPCHATGGEAPGEREGASAWQRKSGPPRPRARRPRTPRAASLHTLGYEPAESAPPLAMEDDISVLDVLNVGTISIRALP